MTPLDYWKECLSNAFEEAGIKVTSEQLHTVAEHIRGGYEHYGLAFYTPSENPLERELKEVKKELRNEQNKVTCEECKGRGRLYFQGPYHGSDRQCWKCHGEGRHLP